VTQPEQTATKGSLMPQAFALCTRVPERDLDGTVSRVDVIPI